MKHIYLDCAASTPVDKDVTQAMLPYFSDKHGNPSSVHTCGQEAQIAVDVARQSVANFLGCMTQEIVFTGSATEANNLAIFGTLEYMWCAGKIPHIITSTIEHESIFKPIEYLEKTGKISVTYIPVSKEGFIDMDVLEKSLQDDTVLVSIMYANNEIGTIQPIVEIAKIIQDHNKNSTVKTVFHTDAAQAVNYLDATISSLGVDMLTISGHKIYAPKGIGVLYVKQGISFSPLFHGAGQEYGKRSGTENVPYIVGLGLAISNISKIREQVSKDIKKLRDFFIYEIVNNISDTTLNGSAENRLPNNINILFSGVDASDLLLLLDNEGIAASAGSACQSKALLVSHVLHAIGFSDMDAKSSLRFSLGKYTTKEELTRTVAILVKLVEKLRKIV